MLRELCRPLAEKFHHRSLAVIVTCIVIKCIQPLPGLCRRHLHLAQGRNCPQVLEDFPPGQEQFPDESLTIPALIIADRELAPTGAEAQGISVTRYPAALRLKAENHPPARLPTQKFRYFLLLPGKVPCFLQPALHP